MGFSISLVSCISAHLGNVDEEGKQQEKQGEAHGREIPQKCYNSSGIFCLFVSKKTKREPKVATPLPLCSHENTANLSDFRSGMTLGMHSRRERVNQDHGVEILVNKKSRNRPKVQI